MLGTAIGACRISTTVLPTVCNHKGTWVSYVSGGGKARCVTKAFTSARSCCFPVENLLGAPSASRLRPSLYSPRVRLSIRDDDSPSFTSDCLTVLSHRFWPALEQYLILDDCGNLQHVLIDVFILTAP